MSLKLTHEEIASYRLLIGKARLELYDLSARRKEWTQRIPAQSDDSDVVLHDAVNGLVDLLDRVVGADITETRNKPSGNSQ